MDDYSYGHCEGKAGVATTALLSDKFFHRHTVVGVALGLLPYRTLFTVALFYASRFHLSTAASSGLYLHR